MCILQKPWEDRTQPLVPALQGQGAPDVEPHANIPLKKLPHDSKGHLLHPGVVWFGEDLDPDVLGKAAKALQTCDLFMTVGTSLWCTQRPALQLRSLQEACLWQKPTWIPAKQLTSASMSFR
ncbi:hypothetical protein WJX77_011128 [Trebouxia sp. C0004]